MTQARIRLLYGIFIAVVGLAAAGVATHFAPPDWASGWQFAAFIAATVFAVHFGFPLSNYSSLDRIPQVAAILVLGPVQAAWINAAASFVFPLINRSYNGGRYDFAVSRGLHNSGMFLLTMLAGGYVYLALGGTVPLRTLGLRDAAAVLAMALVMQVINAVMVALRTRIERGDLREAGLSYSDVLDVAIVPVGVLSAIMLNRLEPPVIGLFLVLIVLLVLVVNRLALSRRELQQRNAELEVSAAKDRLFIELQRRTYELQRQSTEDPLTGLANRRHLDAYLGGEVERARQTAAPLSIAIADVDHFKHINDQHGHAIGDQVLRATAVLLRQQCRGLDLVARYGGEEFAMALPHTDLDVARVRCEQIRAAYAAYNWSQIVPGLQVTISIGVADLDGSLTAERLFERADANLYRAKREGRNLVVG